MGPLICLPSNAPLCFVTALATILWAAAPSSAAEVVDQSYYLYPARSAGAAQAGESLAQTFTAGTDGQLTALDLFLGDRSDELPTLDPFRVDIRPLVNGVPSADPASALTSAEFPVGYAHWDDAGGWRQYALPPIDVLAGDQLAIVITPAGQAKLQWRGDVVNNYPGGAAFQRTFLTGDDTFVPVSFFFGDGTGGPGDFGFQTYVTPTVPEPGTLAAAAAVIALSMLRRKHRRH